MMDAQPADTFAYRANRDKIALTWAALPRVAGTR